MKVKINDSLICIPPYISTTWDQISSLESKPCVDLGRFSVIFHLIDGKCIEIPNLDSSVVDIVFAAHIKYLEGASKAQKEQISPAAFISQMTGIPPEQMEALPIRFDLGSLPGGIEGIESAFSHNSEKADTPDLPPEVLEKIVSIARMMGGGELENFPKAEPHCNCTHCQLGRAIHGTPRQAEPVEEEVSDDDLTFRNWEIEQTGENLFTVTNPIDAQESYRVFLGKPVGCTCGEPHCEHIRAVLMS